MHPDGVHYIYHNRWPERKPLPVDVNRWGQLFNTHLATLIRTGEWQPFYLYSDKVSLPSGA